MLVVGGSTTSGVPVNGSLRFNTASPSFLTRTAVAPTNNKIWTWAGWVKRGALNTSTTNRIMSSATNGDEAFRLNYVVGLGHCLEVFFNGGANGQIRTDYMFLDPSAWFHLVVAVDTTQASSAQRVRAYINGIENTSWNNAPAVTLNTATSINAAGTVSISNSVSTEALDASLAEVYFVDGQQLTPSSFITYDVSEGRYVPIRYSGTYGNNGFYLQFTDKSSLPTSMGYDKSGNGNNWQPNGMNVATNDFGYSLSYDSPTNVSSQIGNFCVLNQQETAQSAAITDNNLTLNILTNTVANYVGTMYMTSGKFYCEMKCETAAPASLFAVGVGTQDTNYVIYNTGGNKNINGSSSIYGSSWGTAGDIIGIALDITGGTVTFYKNGVSQGSISLPASTYPWVFYGAMTLSSPLTFTSKWNFGQLPWQYTTAPALGYNATCTSNLPDPLIPTPFRTAFNTGYYPGSASGATVSELYLTKQSDFIWIKNITTGATSHVLTDSTRGVTQTIYSDNTQAQLAIAQGLQAFNSTSFQIGTDTKFGAASNNYAYYAWSANAGTTNTNTNGSITSSVQSNLAAGFSIVSYTGTGANATIGHGLSSAPTFIYIRALNLATSRNAVYFKDAGATVHYQTDSVSGANTSSTVFNNTAPTSTVFSVGTDNKTNASGTSYIAYCFTNVPGYSASGSYAGTGTTDGVFVNLGFTPAFLLIKGNTSAAWFLYSPANGSASFINATNGSAGVPYVSIDSQAVPAYLNVNMLSNGFKATTSDTKVNTGVTYYYMAFASFPFKVANAFI